MSVNNFIIFILIVVVLALALWVRSLEKALDDLETTMLGNSLGNMAWREKQEKINDRTLKWCKNTDKTIDDMLDIQEKLVEMGNETYTKYLEVQAQINGIKFMLNTYCVADECEMPVQEEEEE